MTSPDSQLSPPNAGKAAIVFGAVISLHAVALWALNSGLIQQTLTIKEPEPIVALLIAPPPPPEIKPPEPQPLAPPPPPKEKPKPRPKPPKPRPAKPKPRIAPKPAPQPLAVKDAYESAMAVPAPSPPAPPAPPAPPPEPPPAPPAPPAPPPPPKIVLPSTSASHLNNPAPEYPNLSRRMHEEGVVMLRVLVSADGRAEQVEVFRSSGFSRLDESALRAVRKWRFRPGTKNGEPQSMWFKQPIRFSLDN